MLTVKGITSIKNTGKISMFLFKRISIGLFIWLAAADLFAQIQIKDPYFILKAKADDPLFTTYAASLQRSRFFADKAYFMNYFTPDQPVSYSSQYAGILTVVWKINNIVIDQTRDFYRPPVVIASFPDMAVLNYAPFEGLAVQETFFVYSSGAAVIDLRIHNRSSREFRIDLFPVLYLPDDSLQIVRFSEKDHGYLFTHHEPLTRPFSNLYKNRDYPTQFRNLLCCNEPLDSYGAYNGCRLQDFYFAAKRASKVQFYVKKLNEVKKGFKRLLALQKSMVLKPGQSKHIRFVRGVQDARKPLAQMRTDVHDALKVKLQTFVDQNLALFKHIPRLKLNRLEKMVYLGAFNLVRQCMLPPRGKTKFNYYVFSRNPIWGWGHGHQVMHESLSMLSYVFVDAKSAQQSQRIYMEQQYPDGLIPYRVGPRGPQVYPHNGQGTTSAPFFSWTNWEIYRVSKDRVFLRDAYRAGAKYVRYLERERDRNKDGMFEWGPYGIIENVRDGWNVVFQLFSEGQDEGRDISHDLDDLDLTCQVANEMRYLSLMAKELGDEAGQREWSQKFKHTAELINRYMFDAQDRFYYHINMHDHSFRFEGQSLKRQEIIGFLPMWAMVATKKQAKALLEHLTNPNTFWRKYGIPTLSAADPDYSPFVDGCCHWNGPVWLLWDYMVFRGLQNYGYTKLASRVKDKMMLAVTTQLKKNHRFWESYSADFPVQESPPNYIWDSIMARVLIDCYGNNANR